MWDTGETLTAKVTSEKVIATTSNIKSHFKGQPLLRRKQLQYALKDMGLYSSYIDGVYGRKTEQGFMNFQNIQDAKYRSAEELFQLILSKVDVPTSFAVSRTKQPKANTQLTITKHQSGLGYTPYGTTLKPVEQARDICKPQAEAAFDAALKNLQRTGKCTGYGGSKTCTVQPDTWASVGASAGILFGMAVFGAENSTMAEQSKKVMKACMAQYGWRKN